MQICSKCNRNVEQNFNYCPYCGGTIIQQNNQQSPYGYNSNNTSPLQNQGEPTAYTHQNPSPFEYNNPYIEYHETVVKKSGKNKKSLVIVLAVILAIAITATIVIFALKDTNSSDTSDISYNTESIIINEEDSVETTDSSKTLEEFSSEKNNVKEKEGIGDTLIKKAKEQKFSIGKVTGSKYKNEYFQIGCTLSGWTYTDKEKMLSELNDIKYLLSDNTTDEEFAEELENIDMYMDMQATGSGAANVNIIVEKTEGKNIASNEKNVLNAMKNAAQEQYESLGIEIIESEIIECDFDGTDKYAIHSVFNYDGFELETYQLVFVKEKHAATITITAENTNEIEEVLSNFYYL